MHIERLTILAAHLEQLEHTLNMNVWSCGTAACAMGEACMIPAFQEQGLRKDYDDPESQSFTPCYQDEAGKFRISYGAAEAFFRISYNQAVHLFSPSRYTGDIEQLDPKIVAARIRQLIEENKNPVENNS